MSAVDKGLVNVMIALKVMKLAGCPAWEQLEGGQPDDFIKTKTCEHKRGTCHPVGHPPAYTSNVNLTFLMVQTLYAAGYTFWLIGAGPKTGFTAGFSKDGTEYRMEEPVQHPAEALCLAALKVVNSEGTPSESVSTPPPPG